jgi:DnaK suppressor protein
MNKAELEKFRQHLLALRSRVNGDVSHLTGEALQREGAGNPSTMPVHMADLGTDAFEQEFTLSLLANEENVLAQISRALDKIDQGTFGKCEECEAAIPKARLKELPYTRYCVSCARKLEEKA